MRRPTRTSYSALSTYENCPRSYALYYLEGHDTEAGPAANRGTRLHLACERFLRDEIPYEKLPIEFIHIRDELAMMKSLGAKAEEVWLVDEHWSIQEAEDHTTRYKAVVDIHYLVGDTLHIRDLKTGRAYPEHADQLQSYAACGAAKYPHVKDIIVAPLYLEGIGPGVTYSIAIVPFLQNLWRERWDKLFAEAEWPANPSPEACRYCDYVKMGLCDSPWGRK